MLVEFVAKGEVGKRDRETTWNCFGVENQCCESLWEGDGKLRF